MIGKVPPMDYLRGPQNKAICSGTATGGSSDTNKNPFFFFHTKKCTHFDLKWQVLHVKIIQQNIEIL
jgi:hypothetical protein